MKPKRAPTGGGQHPAVPARLYAAVPYTDFIESIERGLKPGILRESKSQIRREADGGEERPALLTVYARDAEREGMTFRPVDGGWKPARRIKPHLLSCRDKRALRAFHAKSRVSAGGLVVSSLENPRVLLLLRRKGDATAWKTPKGGVERGESRRQAARREVREEAGLKRLRIVGRLGSMQYFKRREDGRLREKTVHLYLMLSRDGEQAIAPRDGEHFVSCEWLSPEDAIARVTQPQARRLIARAQQRLRASSAGS